MARARRGVTYVTPLRTSVHWHRRFFPRRIMHLQQLLQGFSLLADLGPYAPFGSSGTYAPPPDKCVQGGVIGTGRAASRLPTLAVDVTSTAYCWESEAGHR